MIETRGLIGAIEAVDAMAAAVRPHAESLARLAVEETGFGVVAAVVPSTNPTSTAISKILVALKGRCPIVLSPHPSATTCITRVAEIMAQAATAAGAPAGAINWMTAVSREGTQELMKHRDVAVILATGGMGLVRAAYSAGKPAYGVGRAMRRATSNSPPTSARPRATS